jgi:hypothetical protein
LVCFVTLVVGGPLVTVRSPLPLLGKFIPCFFVCSFSLAVLFFYQKWVLTPVNLPEAKSNIHEYNKAGFSG